MDSHRLPHLSDHIPLNVIGAVTPQDWLWDFIARTSEELTNRLSVALKSFIDDSPKKRLQLRFSEMISDNRNRWLKSRLERI